MSLKQDRKRKTLYAWLGIGVALAFLCACATPPDLKEEAAAGKKGVLQGINVSSLPDKSVVEIVRSDSFPFTAFKLVDPHRIIVDVQGVPAGDLPETLNISKGCIDRIQIQGIKGAENTRVTLLLIQETEYTVKEHDKNILVELIPKGASPAEKAGAGPSSEGAGPADRSASQGAGSEPRIFYKAGASGGLTQILGIDFTMLEKAACSVKVTTNKKVQFDVKRKGARALLVHFKGASIPPNLLRPLDTTFFEGAVERIAPSHSPDQKSVSLEIALREPVPYHVSQNEGAVEIRFASATKAPPKLTLNPTGKGSANSPEKNSNDTESPVSKDRFVGSTKPFAGEKMSFDFRDADIKNVLYFIANAVGLNIVWESGLSGKVSLKLDNVPWDQALEMVLKPSDLTYIIDGNVMWVLPITKLNDIEIRERERKQALAADKRAEETFQPKIVEYIPVKYRKAEDLWKVASTVIITWGVKEETEKKGEEEAKGRQVMSIDLVLSFDAGTNMIIANGTKNQVERVKNLIAKLDVPEKQVLIEARIVEASTTFSRSLGVQWNITSQVRSSNEVSWWGTPAWAPDNVASDYPSSGNLWMPSLSTNTPTGWSGNLGLSFARLASNSLGGIALDAQLALSEAEGETKILSSPRIVTRDTITASIQQGTKIVIPSGTDENGNKTYEQVDASLKLQVTPKISANDMVMMEVNISDDQPDYANARGENIPITTKNANTTMLVKSGDTVVIGGIYKETEGNSQEGVPGLSKIPLLGWLFKAKYKTTERTELLIFITPSVVPMDYLSAEVK
ncbi:MAG: type IV pilus secretin PilQ [Deltaproteobacteria bacterium]|nr:type IV pilus secretin PilQ [Deltaproteobacteria bacterium]